MTDTKTTSYNTSQNNYTIEESTLFYFTNSSLFPSKENFRHGICCSKNHW